MHTELPKNPAPSEQQIDSFSFSSMLPDNTSFVNLYSFLIADSLLPVVVVLVTCNCEIKMALTALSN